MTTAIEHVDPELAREERQLAVIQKRANMLAAASFLPKAYEGKPNDVAAVLLTADALGLPLTLATLSNFYVIEGKVTPSAQLMLAVAAQHGIETWWERRDDQAATIVAQRPGWEHVARFTFTREMAERAGRFDEWYEKWEKTQAGKWRLAEKHVLSAGVAPPAWTKDRPLKRYDAWWNWTEDMLCHSAVRRMARAVCPDVLLGLPTLDIAEDLRIAPSGVQVAAAEARQEDPAGKGADDDTVDAELVDDVTPETRDETPDAHEYASPDVAQVPDLPRDMPVDGSVGTEPAAPTEPAGSEEAESQYARAVHILAHELGVDDDTLDRLIFDVTGDVSANSVTRENRDQVLRSMRAAAGMAP